MDARCYGKFVGGGTLAALLIVAAFNVLIDPYRAYPRLHLPGFDRWRDGLSSRVARAELVRRGDWDTILLGTSRPKVGLPAGHAAFATNRACNLAVDAALMSEAEIIFDYTRARNPLRRVVLGLDFALFRPQKVNETDFAQSRFNDRLSPFDYHTRHLLGAKALDRSFEFLLLRLRGRLPPAAERDGFQIRTLRAGVSQRALFDKQLRLLAYGYVVQGVDRSEMAALRRLVRTAQAQGMELTLAINPVHALDLELLRAAGGWERFEAWRREVVELVATEAPEGRVVVWDFTGYWPATTESVPSSEDRTTRMKYYFENSHFTPALGALMLDRMFTGATHDFGERLTSGNLDAHTEKIRVQRETYARTQAREIEWVGSIARSVRAVRRRPPVEAAETE